jgi:hypothetical protein
MLRNVFEFFEDKTAGVINGASLKSVLQAENVADSVWEEMLRDCLAKPDCTFDDLVSLINQL